ncbi:hypothetical protein [Salibacterium aidingense]|uniref:hypothetical protein n=1 Tax=Salibacterium aidingense TaxID=384933 RepID=UPI003BC8FF8A
MPDDNGGNSQEVTQAISEIREWLVRIDTNQSNQTQLLTEIKDSANHARKKADDAEDKADRANFRLDAVERRQDENDAKWREDRTEKRWQWGVIATVIVGVLAAGVPIILAFI